MFNINAEGELSFQLPNILQLVLLRSCGRTDMRNVREPKLNSVSAAAEAAWDAKGAWPQKLRPPCELNY